MTSQSRPALDLPIGLALGVGYVALLLSTVSDLGYARDEGFYFQAADAYGRWFQQLLAAPEAALERRAVDRAWTHNHEHPALIKSLFAFSHLWLHQEWELFSEAGTAYRFPGMVLSGLAVTITYLWGARCIGRLAGAVAAVLFAMMPRIFYHSHLDCFDMPVVAMWLVTAYAYFRSIDPGSLRWAIAAGVLYGLFLNTKHNSWLLPPALVVHVVLSRGTSLFRDLKRGRMRLPWALVSMATIGPALFYATWPWIWHDTGKRLADYMRFHVGHVYYNMEFLGQTYWEPPMPLGYAWLMTLGTVPLITLVLAGAGLFFWGRAAWKARRLAASVDVDSGDATEVPRLPAAPELLWVMCILLSFAPWWNPSTPIFGGTKHWLTAYPFLCLFAGLGFVWLVRRLKALLPERWAESKLAEVGLLATVLPAPVTTTLQSHPWGLSAYTPIVGGASGAATLGLNRTFWGYTTGAVQGWLNDNVPPRTSVFIHDMAYPSWQMMLRDGRLRRDFRGSGAIHSSDVALYHHEQHMARVEYQVWIDYGTTQPVHVGTHHGVPVITIYQRPKR